MNLDIFIDRFAYAIEVESSALNADTIFKLLPIWDSLNTLSVIAMADADFGIALSGNDIESSKTIGDLWVIVEDKLPKT